MVIQREPSALNAKSSDSAMIESMTTTADASSPGVEKGLFEFFGWKALACVMPFFS